MKTIKLSGNSRRSGICIGYCAHFPDGVSTLVAGLGVFSTGHNQRATVDLAYATALDAAEAGVNYEYLKISHG